MNEGTPVGSLLKTVFESILEVFLLCLAGYVLARKGILDRATQKKLNRINVSLFTPALLFSKVAFFLSPEKLRELWVIPIVFIVTTVVSMVVAFVLGWAFRLKKSQRSFAIAAAMFMNSNSLPIALMQSLVETVPILKWGEQDNADAMLGRALTYLVLYSTLGMIVRWSYGVRLLSQADPESVEHPVEREEDATDSPLLERDEVPFPPSPAELRLHHHMRKPDSESASDTEVEYPNIVLHGPEDTGPQFFYSFPNSPAPQAQIIASSSASEDEDEYEDPVEMQRRRRDPLAPTSSRMHSFVRRVRHRIKKAFRTVKEFMTVPLWAALASLIVACIRPVQHVLEVHVEWVKGAITQAGNVSIPLTLVVLGAYFYPAPPEDHKALPQHHVDQIAGEDQSSRRSLSTAPSQMSLVDNLREILSLKSLRNVPKDTQRKKERSRPGETRTVVVAILARMVITPLLLLPLIALGAKSDFQKVFEDPIFVVANVLLIASPPALTLAQITQAASGDAFERLISRTIFWSYCVVTPPSTLIAVVVGLLLSKL